MEDFDSKLPIRIGLRFDKNKAQDISEEDAREILLSNGEVAALIEVFASFTHYFKQINDKLGIDMLKVATAEQEMIVHLTEEHAKDLDKAMSPLLKDTSESEDSPTSDNDLPESNEKEVGDFEPTVSEWDNIRKELEGLFDEDSTGSN